MNFLVVIGTVILNSPFYSSLASSFIVSSVIGLFLPRYLLNLQKPHKLEFIFIESDCNEINFPTKASPSIRYDLVLSFKSYSKSIAFKNCVYWHIFIPKSLLAESHSTEGSNTIPTKRDGGEDFDHFAGGTHFPIYPDLTRSLGFKFNVAFSKNSSVTSYTIYYYFATEYGLYPKGVKEPIEFKDCAKMLINFTN